MGCNQPGITQLSEFLQRRFDRIGKFAVAMWDKLKLRDNRYSPDKRYTLVDLINHYESEHEELIRAFELFDNHLWKTNDPPNNDLLKAIENECIDVANMAFLIREECLRQIEENTK